MISRYGGSFFGNDNLNNPGSLDWVLEAIQYPIFGADQYPVLAQKTAILSWIINEGHVFYDGNKRTSTMSAMLFLIANGHALEATPRELIEIAESIAMCKTSGFTFKEYVAWIKERLREI